MACKKKLQAISKFKLFYNYRPLKPPDLLAHVQEKTAASAFPGAFVVLEAVTPAFAPP